MGRAPAHIATRAHQVIRFQHDPQQEYQEMKYQREGLMEDSRNCVQVNGEWEAQSSPERLSSRFNGANLAILTYPQPGVIDYNEPARHLTVVS